MADAVAGDRQVSAAGAPSGRNRDRQQLDRLHHFLFQVVHGSRERPIDGLVPRYFNMVHRVLRPGSLLTWCSECSGPWAVAGSGLVSGGGGAARRR